MINLNSIIIYADSNGNYPVKSVMHDIQKANNTLNLGIVFPDKPLSEICLADLRLKSGEKCVYAYSEGIKWDNELCSYTERKLYLYFGKAD